MASDTPSILTVSLPCAHMYLHIHTPDNCHVARSFTNECVGIMFSLTLIVLTHLLKNFAPFKDLKYFNIYCII